MDGQQHLWDIRQVRDLALIVLALLVLWAVYAARSVTAPVVIGMALAYVFNPVVTYADRQWRLRRWASASIILGAFALAVLLFLLWAVPLIYQQINQLVTNVPKYVGQLAEELGIAINREQLTALIGNATADQSAGTPEGADYEGTIEALKQYAGPASTAVKYVYLTLIAIIGWIAGVATYLPIATIIIAFCFFFFTWHWARIIAWLRQFIPGDVKPKTLDVLSIMDRTVSSFIRGRLIQALLMGMLLSIGWAIFGVPYWLLLGMGCGLLNLVPFMAIVGCIVALILASVDHLSGNSEAYRLAIEAAELAGEDPDAVVRAGFRIMVLVWPAVVFVIAQSLDNWVVEPVVQGKATNLDPLSVLLAVMIGGTLAGLLGMLLAIPAAACIKILGQQVLVPTLREYAKNRGRPPDTEKA